MDPLQLVQMHDPAARHTGRVPKVSTVSTSIGDMHMQQHKDNALVTICETGKLSHVISVESIGSVPEVTILFGSRNDTDLRLIAKDVWKKFGCDIVLCIGVRKRPYPELREILLENL